MRSVFSNGCAAVLLAALVSGGSATAQAPAGGGAPPGEPKTGGSRVGPMAPGGGLGGALGGPMAPGGGALGGGMMAPGAGGGRLAPKSKLEEMLEQALKSNPDIRVAGAKVQEAEAELNRARLDVARKVVGLYAALDSAKKAADGAEQRLADVRKLAEKTVISKEDVQTAEKALAQAKADLAKFEAEVPYLLGKQLAGPASVWDWTLGNTPRWQGVPVGFTPAGGAGGGPWAGTFTTLDGFNIPVAQVSPKTVQGTVADRIRKALDTPVNINYKAKPLSEILKEWQATYGLTFINKLPDDSLKVTLQMEGQPLGAVFQAIGDETQIVEFLVRDYGILVALHAHEPDGALRLHDFWKARRVEAPTTGKAASAEGVEGLVKTAESDGLLKLSIGSDAGLVKGQTLELFRTTPAPKYLGRVRILEVTPQEAVAQPVGQLKDKPQAGDKVTSRI